MSTKTKQHDDYIALPKQNATLTQLHAFITEWNDKREFFDRKSGYVSWCQGKALLQARKICKRGKWQDFLQTVGLKRATAYHLMRIARDIPEKNALKLTYVEMLRVAYPSFSAEYKASTKDAPEHPSARGGRRGGKRKVVTVVQVATTMASIKRQLQRLGNGHKVPTGMELSQHRERVGQALSDARTAQSELVKIIGKLDTEYRTVGKRIAGQKVTTSKGKGKKSRRAA